MKQIIRRSFSEDKHQRVHLNHRDRESFIWWIRWHVWMSEQVLKRLINSVYQIIRRSFSEDNLLLLSWTYSVLLSLSLSWTIKGFVTVSYLVNNWACPLDNFLYWHYAQNNTRVLIHFSANWLIGSSTLNYLKFG